MQGQAKADVGGPRCSKECLLGSESQVHGVVSRLFLAYIAEFILPLQFCVLI